MVMQLNDELVKKQLPNCDTVDDFKHQLGEATQMEAAAQVHRLVVDSLATAIGERVVADLPESLVRATGEQECVDC